MFGRGLNAPQTNKPILGSKFEGLIPLWRCLGAHWVDLKTLSKYIFEARVYDGDEKVDIPPPLL